MGDTWRLKKIEANTIYTQEHITVEELITEMFHLVLAAHHGCLTSSYTAKREKCGTTYVDSYSFVYEFNGEKVAYIFEREENEK